jgi:hypothetical protein
MNWHILIVDTPDAVQEAIGAQLTAKKLPESMACALQALVEPLVEKHADKVSLWTYGHATADGQIYIEKLEISPLAQASPASAPAAPAAATPPPLPAPAPAIVAPASK